MARPTPQRKSVFLNVPYDEPYEGCFVALIAALIAIGRTPRCTLEVPETGAGRLQRILKLMRSCRVSIHDLSRAELPSRFNMPFELGIAFGLSRLTRSHDFVLLESKRYRLDKTLSDLKGIEPLIHGGKPHGVIVAVLDALARRSGNPAVQDVESLYRKLWRLAKKLKKMHRPPDLFSRMIFYQLVDAALLLATTQGLIRK